MKRQRKQKDTCKELERDLMALEGRIVRDLRMRLNNMQNTSLEDPTELLDMASDGEIDYMSALSAEAGSATVEEIEQALRKLREGTHGLCESCGKPISKRRLQVRPFAVLCVKCKEAQERRGYREAPSEVSVRGDYGMTVDLTDKEADVLDSPLEDVFREIEDIEVY
jgi:DnaK suppressor protein